MQEHHSRPLTKSKGVSFAMAVENPTTDDLLKSELLRLDIELRRQQNKWETPRAIFGIATAIFLAGAAVGAVLITGFTRPHPIDVRFSEPVHVLIAPEKQP